MNYQIEDVFSPRSFPLNTYITRRLDAEETVDERLQQALLMKGNLIFVSGASKSGKTVLCHRIIANDRYIDLSGNQISNRQDFWNHIAEQLPLSDAVITTTATSKGDTTQTNFSAKLNLGVASLDLGAGNSINAAGQQSVAQTSARTERQIIKYLIDNDKVLVIDDFHYVTPEMQMYIARTLKTELFNGLKAVIISLPHRSDEAIVCNPDLIGRTTSIEIPPWSKQELQEIATKGFKLLKLEAANEVIELLAQESITSPQLMQDNCFQLAYLACIKKTGINLSLAYAAFRKTAQNYGHYERIVKNIEMGPAQGIGRRKQYPLAAGTADIYQLLLLAMKADPPVTELSVMELKERMRRFLQNGTMLTTAVIAAALNKMIAIVQLVMPDLDALEYRNQCLYILDPFFLFYLRWKN